MEEAEAGEKAKTKADKQMNKMETPERKSQMRTAY
jgi:hypothetical protein